MPRLTSILALLSLIVTSFAQTRSPQAGLIRPIDGPRIFRDHCATCHGSDAHGNGPAASALKHKLPDLTTLALRNGGNFPSIHVRNIVLLGTDELLPSHGSKEMPIWGPIFHEIEFDQDFGHVRLENLLLYLQSIQRK